MMIDAPERIYLDGDVEAGDGMFPRCFENPKYASEPQVEYIRADLATPMRCAECDCENGGADCNWIATPAPAMCCLGLTPKQCAHTPSSQCEGLRPAVNPLDDPRVKALVEALRRMVYETTSLSPLEDDGSHWCKISKDALAQARAALSALENNK